jgi:chromosome segregation ATPase
VTDDLETVDETINRLQAEVADLKAQLWNRTHQADALRAACDKALAEVERLRAEVEEQRKFRANAEEIVHIHKAEVERLREALDRAGDRLAQVQPGVTEP